VDSVIAKRKAAGYGTSTFELAASRESRVAQTSRLSKPAALLGHYEETAEFLGSETRTTLAFEVRSLSQTGNEKPQTAKTAVCATLAPAALHPILRRRSCKSVTSYVDLERTLTSPTKCAFRHT